MFERKLEEYEKNGYKHYRVPGIIVTEKGTVIVCYEGRYGNDWSAMDMFLRRSIDGGKTWTERKLIASGDGINVIHNGILFADQDTVHFIWHENYRRAFYIRSLDEGETWSAPREITDAYLGLRGQYNWTVAAAGPGHGLTASDGRLLIPVWLSANKADITSHHPSVIAVLYSGDHGDSWQFGDIIWNSGNFVDPNESVLVELSDGRFMINCRHETGDDARKIGFSADGVTNWYGFYSEPQLIDPVCAAGTARSEDVIFFTNCACRRSEGRKRLTVRSSRDEGKTWSKGVELSEYGGYSDTYFDRGRDCLYVIGETGRAEQENPFSFGLSVFAVSCSELKQKESDSYTDLLHPAAGK